MEWIILLHMFPKIFRIEFFENGDFVYSYYLFLCKNFFSERISVMNTLFISLKGGQYNFILFCKNFLKCYLEGILFTKYEALILTFGAFDFL